MVDAAPSRHRRCWQGFSPAKAGVDALKTGNVVEVEFEPGEQLRAQHLFPTEGGGDAG